jgi:hypothetical protein
MKRPLYHPANTVVLAVTGAQHEALWRMAHPRFKDEDYHSRERAYANLVLKRLAKTTRRGWTHHHSPTPAGRALLKALDALYRHRK